MRYAEIIFEEMDLFGQIPRFNVNGKYKVKTHIGSVLGFITLGLIFISTWLIGNDIIYHKKPQINFQS